MLMPKDPATLANFLNDPHKGESYLMFERSRFVRLFDDSTSLLLRVHSVGKNVNNDSIIELKNVKTLINVVFSLK